MTEDHDIAIELKEGAEADACKALDAVGIGAEELTPVDQLYKLSLKGADRSVVSSFLDALRAKDLGRMVSHRVTRHYSDEELGQAPWLSLTFDTPYLDDPEPSYDSEGACTRCGAGAEPKSPLRFARNQMGRRLLDRTASAGLLIVHKDLAERITMAGLTGVRFEPAVLGREREAFSWAHITSCLPAASPDTPFVRSKLCKRCRRGGYQLRPDEPLGLRYDNKDDLEPAADFNVTWECVFSLGSQTRPLGGRRVIVVSQQTRGLLDAARVAKVRCSPVEVG